MDPSDAKTWFEIGMSAGPLWVVFAVVIFFLVRYVPAMVARHLALMDQLSQTQIKICESLDVLVEKWEH